MRTWIDAATLVKYKHSSERLVAREAAGLNCALREGMEVRFVPPQLDLVREARVSEVVRRADGTLEVAFSGAGGSEAAGLVGMHCLVKRDEVEDAGAEASPAGWKGFSVRDADGRDLGVLVDIVDNPAHYLLEVKRADSNNPFLVPAVEEFIVDVDEDARRLTVSLPAGLTDL